MLSGIILSLNFVSLATYLSNYLSNTDFLYFLSITV